MWAKYIQRTFLVHGTEHFSYPRIYTTMYILYEYTVHSMTKLVVGVRSEKTQTRSTQTQTHALITCLITQSLCFVDTNYPSLLRVGLYVVRPRSQSWSRLNFFNRIVQNRQSRAYGTWTGGLVLMNQLATFLSQSQLPGFLPWGHVYMAKKENEKWRCHNL
jgi:hypothetical protein